MINDVGKLAILLTALVGGLVVLVLGLFLDDGTAVNVGLAIVGPIVGYVTGNGVLAARSQPPSPLIVSKHPEQYPDPGDTTP